MLMRICGLDNLNSIDLWDPCGGYYAYYSCSRFGCLGPLAVRAAIGMSLFLGACYGCSSLGLCPRKPDSLRSQA